jgi:hypothetical protein
VQSLRIGSPSGPSEASNVTGTYTLGGTGTLTAGGTNIGKACPEDTNPGRRFLTPSTPDTPPGSRMTSRT